MPRQAFLSHPVPGQREVGRDHSQCPSLPRDERAPWPLLGSPFVALVGLPLGRARETY